MVLQAGGRPSQSWGKPALGPKSLGVNEQKYVDVKEYVCEMGG